jgi:hypothetical protein
MPGMMPQQMMKVSPAGRLVAPMTGRPWQSTASPTVAAAPLKMGPKNGSTGVSSAAPRGDEVWPGGQKVSLPLGRASGNREDARCKPHLRPRERGESRLGGVPRSRITRKYPAPAGPDQRPAAAAGPGVTTAATVVVVVGPAAAAIPSPGPVAAAGPGVTTANAAVVTASLWGPPPR